MPCCAASDLGLHCVPMSQKWDTRLIWVTDDDDEFWYSGIPLTFKIRKFKTSSHPNLEDGQTKYEERNTNVLVSFVF